MKEGIVIKTTGSWHTVKDGKVSINCRLKGIFRTHSMRNTNPVAVGDHVLFEYSDEDTGMITKIMDRKNYIIRKSTNLSHENQIMAANIDQVMLMFTLDLPETPLEFVDRFLLSAEAYHIPCVLIINKIDVYEKKRIAWLNEVTGIYEYAGYQVIGTSVTANLNMDKISEILAEQNYSYRGKFRSWQKQHD